MKKYIKINDIIDSYEKSTENIYAKLNKFHEKEFKIEKSEKNQLMGFIESTLEKHNRYHILQGNSEKIIGYSFRQFGNSCNVTIYDGRAFKIADFQITITENRFISYFDVEETLEDCKRNPIQASILLKSLHDRTVIFMPRDAIFELTDNIDRITHLFNAVSDSTLSYEYSNDNDGKSMIIYENNEIISKISLGGK